tara:strand:+ start:100 stop:210 length:111 start_codon:yes stop_codon:yes gene_type:complete
VEGKVDPGNRAEHMVEMEARAVERLSVFHFLVLLVT